MIEINVEEETTVNLRGCSQEAIDSLGRIDALKVNGHLSLYDCKGLTKLSGGLRVNGDLDISGRKGLKKLPVYLMVNGYLNLVGCTGLTELPDDLMVGYLFLYGCSGITKLPEDLQVEGRIYYNSETGFSGHEDEPGVIPERLKHKLRMV